MTVSKERVLNRISELLELNKEVLKEEGSWNQINMEKVILGTLTIIKMTYGEGTNQEMFLTTLRDDFFANKPHSNNVWKITTYISGFLDTLKSDIEFDFIESIEKKAAGEVYGDLLTLSKKLIDENSKEAAAVLACGALEDSLKKYAQHHGLNVFDSDLSQVINSLKSKSLLKGPQAGVVQSYVALRNKAFHAQFDKIEIPEIKSLIAFIESFLFENFK
ncbi:MAG: hypothetical protein JNL69_08435 [Bacteroidia bacterium]|nr:hypothetical protein [Bacteroidia bacterium]